MKPYRMYRLGFFRLSRRITLYLPRPVFHRIAEVLGMLVYATRPKLREILRANLAKITGAEPGVESDQKQLSRLCRANIASFSRMLADYFFSICCKPEAIKTLLADCSGKEALEAALARGKGVILVTAHLGHWELGGICLAMEGLPLNIVTAPEPSKELNEWRQAYREKFGIKTITLGTDPFAFMEVINALKRNEIVAMLVDRPAGNSAIPVQFCGGKTFFSNGPALLRHHTGAAIIPAFTLQTPEDQYVLFTHPEVLLEESTGEGGMRGAIARNTQKIADTFGDLIRKHPDQWHNYIRIWTDENQHP